MKSMGIKKMSMPRKRRSSLGFKLNMTLGVFFILFWGIISFIFFNYERSVLVSKAKSACEEILMHVDAVQDYTREVMRPQMYNLLSEDEFIPETMSTTFVARHVIERFLDVYPEYYFKFATDNPRNELNLADEKELAIIELFRENPDLERWDGILERNGVTHLAVATPIRFSESCTRCHSRPEIAPGALTERYGDTAGFFREEGEIAIKSVSIPIDGLLNSAKASTLRYGLLAAFFLAGLFLLSSMLLRRLVTSPLKRLRHGAERLGTGEHDIRLDIKGSDEIEDLARSFNRMAEKIHESHSMLEHRVEKRTGELNVKIAELEGFNREMVGREMRMIELKKEINSLLVSDGMELKYEVSDLNVESDDPADFVYRETQSMLAAVADIIPLGDWDEDDPGNQG